MDCKIECHDRHRGKDEAGKFTVNRLLGVVRDLLVNRRIHTVYRVALPVLIVTQAASMYLFLGAPAWWVRVTNAIVG